VALPIFRGNRVVDNIANCLSPPGHGIKKVIIAVVDRNHLGYRSSVFRNENGFSGPLHGIHYRQTLVLEFARCHLFHMDIITWP